MIRVLPVLVELLLLVYCLVDCIQTPSQQVRNLPKWGWIVLVLLFPIVGGIAWLVAGRPRRGTAGPVPRPMPGATGPRYAHPSRSVAPDDDPAFLEGLRRREEERRRHGRAAGGEEDEEPPAARP